MALGWKLTSLFWLSLPAVARAAAGGGSSGYGGGGGGGGGGYSGGGGGYGGGGTGSAGESGLFLVVIVGLVILFIVGAWIWVRVKRAARRADRMSDDARFKLQQRKRGRHVELAAAEAAADDPAFAVERVIEDGTLLFRAIQAAWSRNDVERLETLVSPQLMDEWRLRLADFRKKGWRNKIDVHSVEVHYVGLVNRESDDEDRVVVRVSARMDDYVLGTGGRRLKRTDSDSETTDLREWWTLGKRASKWILLSIEQREEGEHQMKGELVAAPEHDSRISDEAVTELAAADKVPEGFKVADAADLDFDGTAHDAALDMSLVDGRFTPGVLEAAARRAVAGWAEAVDGDDSALEAVASEEAAEELLYPDGKSSRLVVRGPKIRQLRITGLDAAAEPARMTVEVDVSGRRYVENRDTVALLSGSKDDEVKFTERWTLSLSGPDLAPWQLVDVGAATAGKAA